MKSFNLLPFEKIDESNINIGIDADINIKAKINKMGNQLTIKYELIGSTNVILPTRKTLSPKRVDELWENTCFEFFIAEQGQPQYWEFNLSPSGDWNVYHFQDYRQEMTSDQAIESLPFVMAHTGHDDLTLTVTVDLEKIMSIKLQNHLELSIATIIRTNDNELSYWALNHCGEKPDFHDRSSFVPI